jgi:hypothetical protein
MRVILAAAACAVLAGVSPASAQFVDFDLVPRQSAPGVVLTPMATVGVIFDDNATLVAENGQKRSDTVFLVRPGVDLSLNKKHTTLAASYFGSLMRYRTLDQIDSFDQVGRVQFRHQQSRRVQLFAQNVFGVHPSTDTAQEPDVIFRRTGTRKNALDAGVTVALTRLLQLNALYHFQWLEFDTAIPNNQLRGGASHGATFELRRRLSPRWSVGGTYDLRHTIIGNAGGTADIQNLQGLVKWQMAPTVTLEGAGGISHLTAEDELGPRTAPSGRISIEKHTEYASFSAGAAQTYRTSFGSGHSTASRQLSAGVFVPLASQRASVSGQFLRYLNEPATGEGLANTSNWVRISLGYSLARFARLEGYFAGGYQRTSAQGVVHRNRIGVQFSTLAPMRID